MAETEKSGGRNLPEPGGRAGAGDAGRPPAWRWGGARFGDLAALLAGLSFLFLCMILPLVGKAGARTEWAAKNHAAFAAVLLLTLGLAALASLSKIEQRRRTGCPKPVASLSLTGICLLILLALAGGWLAI